MVRSGMVTQLNRFDNSGVIQDDKGKEFYFNIGECEGNELPKLWSTVTFIKDPDFKSTNVAMLIKFTSLFKRAG